MFLTFFINFILLIMCNLRTLKVKLDTTKGSSTGAFYIQNETYNEGVMMGNFLFCDQTPTITIEPIIDYNSGTIDTNITNCAINIELENNLANISIFPNPTKNDFFVTGIGIQSV